MKNKRLIILLTVALVCLLLTGCGEKTVEPCETHTWNEGMVTQDAGCGEPGVMTYACTVCGEERTEPIAATGAHSMDGDACAVCGYMDMSALGQEEALAAYGYYHVDTDGSHTVNTNDFILFGSYPQTRETDDERIASLGEQLGNTWTDYGYYAAGQQQELMSWQDVELDGVRYRAVNVTGYRPYYTDLAASAENCYAASNGYVPGEVYFFRYEPIRWRVLCYQNGEAMLNSVQCLDGQSFQNTYEKDGSILYNPGIETYANDWGESYIRAFLNSDFYSWAFNEAEQSRVTEQTLNNSATGYSAENTFAADQKDTQDRVYLLSYADLFNTAYGFADVKGNANGDVSVCKTGSDYALSQGMRTSQQASNADGDPCSWWMLRSAGGKSFSMCGVSKNGEVTKANTVMFGEAAADGIVTYTAEGITPVVNITLGK